MTQHKAFIDNGQIKIVQFDGLEYALEITKQKQKLTSIRNRMKLSLIAFFICVTASVSPIFISYFSFGQVGIFIICFIFSAIYYFNNYNKIWENEQYYQKLEMALNLAKESLQYDIIKLQKELTLNNFQIQQLDNKEKFNFKINKTQEQYLSQ